MKNYLFQKVPTGVWRRAHGPSYTFCQPTRGSSQDQIYPPLNELSYTFCQPTRAGRVKNRKLCPCSMYLSHKTEVMPIFSLILVDWHITKSEKNNKKRHIKNLFCNFCSIKAKRCTLDRRKQAMFERCEPVCDHTSLQWPWNY